MPWYLSHRTPPPLPNPQPVGWRQGLIVWSIDTEQSTFLQSLCSHCSVVVLSFNYTPSKLRPVSLRFPRRRLPNLFYENSCSLLIRLSLIKGYTPPPVAGTLLCVSLDPGALGRQGRSITPCFTAVDVGRSNRFHLVLKQPGPELRLVIITANAAAAPPHRSPAAVAPPQPRRSPAAVALP